MKQNGKLQNGNSVHQSFSNTPKVNMEFPNAFKEEGLLFYYNLFCLKGLQVFYGVIIKITHYQVFWLSVQKLPLDGVPEQFQLSLALFIIC